MACRAHSHLQDLVPHVQPPAAPVPIAGDGGAAALPGESRRRTAAATSRAGTGGAAGEEIAWGFRAGCGADVPWGVRMVLDGDRARASSFDPNQTARCFRDFATGHRSLSLSLSPSLFPRG